MKKPSFENFRHQIFQELKIVKKLQQEASPTLISAKTLALQAIH